MCINCNVLHYNPSSLVKLTCRKGKYTTCSLALIKIDLASALPLGTLPHPIGTQGEMGSVVFEGFVFVQRNSPCVCGRYIREDSTLAYGSAFVVFLLLIFVLCLFL